MARPLHYAGDEQDLGTCGNPETWADVILFYRNRQDWTSEF